MEDPKHNFSFDTFGNWHMLKQFLTASFLHKDGAHPFFLTPEHLVPVSWVIGQPKDLISSLYISTSPR
jgi:hypothetical protein